MKHIIDLKTGKARTKVYSVKEEIEKEFPNASYILSEDTLIIESTQTPVQVLGKVQALLARR